MKAKHRLLRQTAGIILAAAIIHSPSPAEEAKIAEKPTIERIDKHRYRINEIVVDKAAGKFTVPGRIIHLNAPLEYLAVTVGGMKEYESLLELTASARDFNLACILIGLDEAKSVKPEYQFSAKPVEGQSVTISVSWLEEGKTVTVSGANAMLQGEETFDNNSWVYIGSETSADGQQFMAEMAGTLIGFVHDPFSVIDHKFGAGMDNYGMISGNDKVLPEEGARITLTVMLVQ